MTTPNAYPGIFDEFCERHQRLAELTTWAQIIGTAIGFLTIMYVLIQVIGMVLGKFLP